MNEGRTEGLSKVSDLLDDSRDSFRLGNYSEAFDLANSAKQSASQSVVEPNSQWLLLLAVLGVGVLAAGLIIIFSRKRSLTTSKEKDIDVEEIRRNHPEIREDDLPVLKFIVDHPDGVYISKLRESIGMPRSKAWKAVARLEETGVIQTSKIGRETFIKIRDKT